MITKKHFEDALSRVRGTLDLDRLEEAERHSWQILYNREQQSTLEEAYLGDQPLQRYGRPGKIEQEVRISCRP